MTEKRRGLGKGLGALIPSGPQSIPHNDRPVDLLFQERAEGTPRRRNSPLIPTGDDDESAPLRTRRAAPSARPVEPTPAAEPKIEDDTSPTRPADVSRETPSPAGREEDTASDSAGEGQAKDEAPTGNGSSPEQPAVEPASRPGSPDPELLTVPGAAFVEIPVQDIRVNPRQPRTVFDEDALEELRQSILQVGVLQPIVVRTVPGQPGYELIMGERRWRASQAAGLTRIPAIVRDTSDDDLLRDALLENLHRSNLNPLEEAAAYEQLLTDFGCTHEELAERIGRSRPQISNSIRLLRLPALVQRRVAAGVLSSGHARALLSLADPAAMERLAQRIVAEGLSVRATEEIVSMGVVDAKETRTRRPANRVNSEALDAITTRLSDVLETRVSAAMSKRKGRLTIEFADMDDLNRILSGLAPEGDAAASSDT